VAASASASLHGGGGVLPSSTAPPRRLDLTAAHDVVVTNSNDSQADGGGLWLGPVCENRTTTATSSSSFSPGNLDDESPAAAAHHVPLLNYTATEYFCCFAATLWIILVATHWWVRGRFCLLHAALSLFNAVHMICCGVLDLSLLVHHKRVCARHDVLRMKWCDRRLPSWPPSVLEKFTLGQALSLQQWSDVWGAFALVEPGVLEKSSVAFVSEMSIGMITFLPSVLLSVASTWDIAAPRVVGAVGLVIYFHIFQQTLVQAFYDSWSSRAKNSRHTHMTMLNICGICSFWVIFPVAWMYVCCRLIATNDMEVLRT